jgi:SAM-dependent methyltransferase
MTLPLTKVLDPADLLTLHTPVHLVRASTALEGQHEMRVWEYAMALHAYGRWWARPEADSALVDQPPLWYDVGGAGSGFAALVRDQTDFTVEVIDPAAGTPPIEDAPDVEAAVVTALSVVEHVEDLRAFLRGCAHHLRPGGLLVLTADFVENSDGGDTYHFHWMRERIFDAYTWGVVASTLMQYGLVHYGDADLTWHGAHVYDYSFVSLCMRKPDARSQP